MTVLLHDYQGSERAGRPFTSATLHKLGYGEYKQIRQGSAIRGTRRTQVPEKKKSTSQTEFYSIRTFVS